MKIGFIGLGSLGYAIASRLIEQGESLFVWNRTVGKSEGLKVEIATSPKEVIDKTQVVCLNLFDSDAVHSVMSGETGLLAGDCKNKVILDTSTNHFEAVDAFHQMFDDAGAKYLEAPVIGSVIPAQNGKLTSIVSGDEEPYNQVLPIINKYSANVFYLKETGLASKAKVINNMVLGTFMATLAESVALGEKSGLSKKQILDILSVGAGNSGVLNAKKDKLLNEDFSNHFSSACIHKDLKYLQELANTLQTPLYTGALVKELYAMTFKEKVDELDFSGIYKVLKG